MHMQLSLINCADCLSPLIVTIAMKGLSVTVGNADSKSESILFFKLSFSQNMKQEMTQKNYVP